MLTAGTLGLAYRKATVRALLLTVLVICAALLEIAQIWVPGRTSQLIDFGASSIGAGGGLLAAAVIDQLAPPTPDGKPMEKEREPEQWG
jgi:VanZ family protein